MSAIGVREGTGFADVNGEWTTLIPLVIIGALVPIQLSVTVLLLRTSFARAAAWVAGLTAARILEGVLVWIAIEAGATGGSLGKGPSETMSFLLVLGGVVFYLAAAQQMFHPTDLESATPSWMSRADSIAPSALFWMGATYLVLSVKSTLVNIAGMGLILEGETDGAKMLVALAAFIALSEAGHLAILATALVSPAKSSERLGALDGWLKRHSRAIVIVIGLVFGTWLLATGLEGLGLI